MMIMSNQESMEESALCHFRCKQGYDPYRGNLKAVWYHIDISVPKLSASKAFSVVNAMNGERKRRRATFTVFHDSSDVIQHEEPVNDSTEHTTTHLDRDTVLKENISMDEETAKYIMWWQWSEYIPGLAAW